MKRRDFVLGAISSTGMLYVSTANALKPCPPLLEGVGSPSCSPTDAEQDWISRINQPGVVWYHDFRSEAEVDAFRWAGAKGNDPNDEKDPGTVNWLSTDGITGGGCLEVFRRAGGSEGAVWWRPFSPLDTGSGKTVNDPAAGGTLTVQPWVPTDGGGQTAAWRKGHYGHPNNVAADPTGFDGSEYFFQCRVNMDPRRKLNPNGGKLFYFTLCRKSLTSQELVTVSGNTRSGENYFHMYRSGSPTLTSDDPTLGGNNQPGNENGFCDWPNTLGNCWFRGTGWDTYLYRIRPGLHSDNKTHVQVWGAKAGETRYTQIFFMDNVDLPFQNEQGQNALICSAYMNGKVFSTDVFQRFDQLIFSKEFIPCPQA